MTFQPRTKFLLKVITKIRYGSIFDISLAGVSLTAIFIIAFRPARGVARARGETEVRHPQCMSQYDEDVDMHDSVDMVVGSEDFEAEDQKSVVISQRCEFFELSPR